MARNFNGSSDLINFGAIFGNPTLPLFVGSWVRLESLPTSNSLTLTNFNAGRGWGMDVEVYNNNGTIGFTKLSQVDVKSTITTPPNGTWAFVGCVVKSTVIRFFKCQDGVWSFENISDSDSILSSTGDFKINADVDGDGAEVVIADNYDPTDEEIKALAFKGSLISAKGNNSFYSPIHGNYSPEPDLSGNVNNGTVTGTTKSSHPPVQMMTNLSIASMPYVSSVSGSTGTIAAAVTPFSVMAPATVTKELSGLSAITPFSIVSAGTITKELLAALAITPFSAAAVAASGQTIVAAAITPFSAAALSSVSKLVAGSPTIAPFSISAVGTSGASSSFIYPMFIQ